MRPDSNIGLNRLYAVIYRSFMILLVVTIGISAMLTRGRVPASSASSQERVAARFENALRQQRQRAKLLVRSSSAESRFQRLSARALESGIVPVIATLRVAYSPQVEVRGEIESQAQRYEIGRVGEGIIDELIGYDPASIKHFDILPIIALTVNASGIESLRQSDNILDIQEDRLHRTSLAQSVPFIGGTNAWASGFTGAGQTVAILDTGVDKNHPMLAGKVVSEACYSTTLSSLLYSSTSVCPGGVSSSTAVNSGLPCPTDCEHGTHVAGIAAGKTVTYNGESFSGVAKDANVIAIQVFSRVTYYHDYYCGGPGTAPCTGVETYTSDFIRGLERVYSLRSTYSIAAANMSLGGGQFDSNCDIEDASTKKIIDQLRAANIATVIASGNEKFTNSLAFPACISTAVSVGATFDSSNTVDSSYSNSASFLSLLAPGTWITSAVPGTGYGTWRGTSMATPHVAGAWAIAKQKSPSASVETVLNAFTSTGVSITDTRNGIVKPRIAVDLAIAQLSGTPTAPVAPTTLAATAFSSTQINLRWRDNSSNETGFLLQRKTGTAGAWTTINSPAANVTTYEDRTVAASTTYYYRIYARNSVGQSVASNDAMATTYGVTTAPTGIMATAISSTQINLSWNDVATNEIGYRIERRLTAGTVWADLATLTPNSRSYQNTGLTPSTGYSYRVSAIAPGGGLVTATSIAAVVTHAPTAAPAIVTVTPFSATQVNVSWVDAATNETGYRIQRRLTSGTSWTIVTNLGPGATTYRDSGLTAATRYSYLISAIAPGGALVSATPVDVTTHAATAAPTAFTARVFSSTQIDLKWNDSAINETAYQVWRRLTSSTTWTPLSVIPANTTSFNSAGLTAATGYTYRVCAVAPGGGQICAADVAARTYDRTTQAAKYISQSVSTSLRTSQSAVVSVTFENTGTVGWKTSDLVRLGSQSPKDNNIWGFGARVTIPEGTIVYPGSRYTFRFNIIAPSKSGSYDFQTGMLQEHVRWFGDLSPKVVIKVQ